jgi:hypothetical protein
MEIPMRKLPLLVGALLLAAAPAFAADMATTAPAGEPAPVVTSSPAPSPEPSEGVAASKPGTHKSMSHNLKQKKHMAHKAHAKMHKASAKSTTVTTEPAATPEATPAQ